MFGKKKDKSEENTVALSQAEVDKLLNKPSKPQPVKIVMTKETEEKIKKLKEKTRAVELKMKNEEKAKKAAAKKTPAKKTTAKKATAKKTVAKKPASKTVKAAKSAKPVAKLSVYYDGKAYGTARLTTRNGKKIVELLTIRK